MPKATTPARRPEDSEARVRRGYFECRYGQLHVHNAIPPGGGFEEGTPLLCLHGAIGTGRAFQRFLPLAGRDRSVYAPDLPGCGESDPPPAPHPQLTDYAAALGDFIDSMRLRQLDVVGYRAGALLAAELTRLRAPQVRRLVMVSVPVWAGVAAQSLSTAFAAAAAHYPWRERLSGLPAQQTLLVRPKDEFWDGLTRVREVLPGARLTDLPEHGDDLLEAGAPALARAVRAFIGD